jgi:predicted nucleotidyltransferase component of viral defense system
MTRAVSNIAASVRQRLLTHAKRRGESFDYIASLYARERFVARLASSPHRNRLILKGATVLTRWLDIRRPTRDLDFLGIGNFAPEEAVSVVRSIVSVEAADGLKFDADSVTAEPIRVADEYHGVRIHLNAVLDTARIRLQLDIGLGDVVTPAPRMAEMPSLLNDFPLAKVKVYPPETIIAEKLQALVKLGIANTRMKDFFDLYVLAQRLQFDEALLAKAVRRTFARRKTAVPAIPFALTAEFYESQQKAAEWRAFVTKSGVEAPEAFTMVGDLLRRFLLPILKTAAADGTTTSRRWRGRRWSAVQS